MSKCQIGKYRPGGRCGGDSGGPKNAGSLGPAFAALLAAREQMDARVVAPCSDTAAPPAPLARGVHAARAAPLPAARAAPLPPSKTAITPFTPTADQRKADIDLILED